MFDAPVVAVVFPDGQAIHSVDLFEGWYSPTAHGRQTGPKPSKENVPALQCSEDK